MSTRRYIETSGTWQCSSSATWETQDLTSYGVPSGAVAEILIANFSDTQGSFVGVRNTSSSISRLLENPWRNDGVGNTMVTMNVQVDTSSEIECYAQRASNVNFHLLGYWPDCTYVEKFNAFEASSAATWQEKDLDVFGVGSGQVSDIAMENIEDNTAYEMGIRVAGSSRTKVFNLGINPGPGKTTLVIPVMASGNDATIGCYASHTSKNRFILLGYFTDPPGTFTETTVIYPKASVTGSWSSFDVGSSGVPNNAIAYFAIGRALNFPVTAGARKTSSSIDRSFGINSSNAGEYIASMSVDIDANGYAEQYDSVVAPFDPEFVCLGYWSDFVGVVPWSGDATLFIEGHIETSGSSDLFIDGYEQLAASSDLFVHGRTSLSASSDLFILGSQEISCSVCAPLYINGAIGISDSANLFIHGRTSLFASCDLFIEGHTPYTSLDDIFKPAGTGLNLPIHLFISGPKLATGSANLFIRGPYSPPPDEPMRIIHHLVKTGDYNPQILGSITGTPTSVNIEVYDIINEQNTLVAIVDSSCYAIGNTDKWGWSTANLPFTQQRKKYHYYYRMLSNEGQTAEGEFFITVPERGRWSHPN